MINTHKTTGVITVKIFILLGYCALSLDVCCQIFQACMLTSKCSATTPGDREQYSRTNIPNALLQEPKNLSQNLL